MKWNVKEMLAAIVVVITIVALPYAIFGNAPWTNLGSMRVIHLTAVTNDGVWTDATVNASNYWTKKYKPAHIVIENGEEVLLRLSSSDVTHSFYVPELNIGPIIVDGGHTEEVVIQSEKLGNYTYYCIIVCGECHYYMQGTVSIVDPDSEGNFTEGIVKKSCDIQNYSRKQSSLIDTGYFLYNQKGCVTCHGQNGSGGVHNPNYINRTVPELNTLADKMKLYWQEDADTILKLLEMDVDLAALEDDPPFRSYNRFLAQYNSIRTKILEGASDLQMTDPQGPIPPLYMPSWEENLNNKEIDAIIAYLISEYSWESTD
jgi:plastocyanin